MPRLSYGPVQAYAESLVPPRDAELAEMERIARSEKFPIIGPACGQYCYQTTRLTRAHKVFELGSGFGYSTAWFARGVRENGGGSVHHTVWDAALSARARRHLMRMGLEDLVTFHVSEALEALRAETQAFDLIFCDIDKEGYPDALPLIKERLRPGGSLLIDNMLWSGRIFDARDRTSATRAVRRFTRALRTDRDWAFSLVPLRDGLIVASLK